MLECADLELSLHRHDLSGYAVEFRYTQPGSDADVRFGLRSSTLLHFNFDQLQTLVYDPTSYGKTLSDSLFADESFRIAFAKARANAQAANAPLRLRLLIGPSAPELHNLLWETLRDPEDQRPLCSGENLFFSRYLSSLDWRPVQLRPRQDLKALAAIAAPNDLEQYNLAPISSSEELAQVQTSLGASLCRSLPEGPEKRVTLPNLLEALRSLPGDEGFDILYLVCHSAFIKNESWLWLENDQGQTQRVAGSDFITALKELKNPPRLIVLAACQSAGAGGSNGGGGQGGAQSGALAALGPQLAEAGIPAVLAMTGNLTMETSATFMPAFFSELQKDGMIDRAMAVARGQVRSRPDQWMPALFMRLKSGRIWYVPGFGDEAGEFEKWQSLVGFLQEGTCTPILGPGLGETILGSQREFAVRWAEKHGYPYSPGDNGDMPRVSQYMATRQNPAYLRLALRETLRAEIIQRYGAGLPEDLVRLNPWPADKLMRAIELAAEQQWAANPVDPYRMLARLRLPIYITASQTNLLAHALKQAGADPQVRLGPWNNMINRSKIIYDEEPTPERPLVYHLFGHISEPHSLVITEDEYFDYLIGMARNKDLIPSAVRAALVSTALLFLGFQLDEWSFRIIFRSLMAQEGGGQRMYYSHVGAQLEPEEGRILDPKRARQYLEKYFATGQISIYWGSTNEFLSELLKRMGETIG